MEDSVVVFSVQRTAVYLRIVSVDSLYTLSLNGASTFYCSKVVCRWVQDFHPKELSGSKVFPITCVMFEKGNCFNFILTIIIRNVLYPKVDLVDRYHRSSGVSL